MELRTIPPNYYQGDTEKTIKELLGHYFSLQGTLQHLLRNLETSNIRELSVDKLSAGTIRALIEIIGPKITGGTIVGETEIIGPTITGGTFRTDESPKKRIEITENQIRCYNNVNSLQGLNIDNTDAQFGDLSFFISGEKAFMIYNTIDSGYTIMPVNGHPMNIGADGATAIFRGILNFFGDATFQDMLLEEQSTPPIAAPGKMKLFYDGTNLKAVLPDGTIKTFTMT